MQKKQKIETGKYIIRSAYIPEIGGSAKLGKRKADELINAEFEVTAEHFKGDPDNGTNPQLILVNLPHNKLITHACEIEETPIYIGDDYDYRVWTFNDNHVPMCLILQKLS